MFSAINPTSGEPLPPVVTLDETEARGVVQQSAQAYEQWRRADFNTRASLLRDVAALMRAEVQQLASLMTQEMGKPIKEARAEVEKAAGCAEHYAEFAADYLATETLASDATVSFVQYLPLGPILGILPWNAPFWLAFRFCAPALMAGNTCLLKHDPHVPACAAAIATVFERVGAPKGVFQNLPLANVDVASVIQNPLVRGVSFTGSERAGSLVAGLAASEIKPVVLELGGADPCVVMADADLDAAIPIITLSRTINAGQSCIAAKRIIVEAPIYDEVVARLTEAMAKLTMGDPCLETTDIGPIARADLREQLHRQVAATVQAGARCLLGGEMPEGPGFFYPPTVLADVTTAMVAAQEETFGPVMVVMRAADEADAIQMANETPYGLAGSVWSRTDRALAIAQQLETGQVAINGIVKTDPRLPSGGIKRSGIGRELGPHGIREFANAQQIWVGPRQG